MQPLLNDYIKFIESFNGKTDIPYTFRQFFGRAVTRKYNQLTLKLVGENLIINVYGKNYHNSLSHIEFDGFSIEDIRKGKTLRGKILNYFGLFHPTFVTSYYLDTAKTGDILHQLVEPTRKLLFEVFDRVPSVQETENLKTYKKLNELITS